MSCIDDELTEKLNKNYKKNKESGKGGMFKLIWKVFFDDRVDLHRELEAMGPVGHNIRTGVDNAAGGATAGLIEVQVGYDEVLGEVHTEEQYEGLANNLMLLRIISLDDHKPEVAKYHKGEELKEILNPYGITAAQGRSYRKSHAAQDPEGFKEIERMSVKYFAYFRRQLEKLHDENLITDEDYEHMKKVGDYSPRRYHKFIDPDNTFNSQAKITTGSTTSMMIDPAQLMKDYTVRLYDRIARNNANILLYDSAENAGKDLVRVVTEEDPAPTETTAITAWKMGEKHQVVFKDRGEVSSAELTRQWVGSDPALNNETMRMLNNFSGASTLRAAATGLNPGFAATNTPRDVFWAWFRTREFSSFAPVGLYQMAKQMYKVAGDVWNTSDKPVGVSKKFFDNFGGLEFMTSNGAITRGYGQAAGKFAALHPVLRGFEKWMSYLGQRSELWVRVAVMEQAIANGKPLQEAVWIARSYLDFAQGGSASKILDKAMPYLNVGMISTRGLIETFKKDRALAVWKSAQFSTLFMLLAAHYMVNEPEKLAHVSDRDRANNFIFLLPWEDIDADNNARYPYLRIAMDQGQAALTGLYTLAFSKVMKELHSATDHDFAPKGFMEPDYDKLWQSVEPIIPFINDMPPVMRAMVGYLNNYDTYFDSDIYRGKELPTSDRGKERSPDTHFLFSAIADTLNLALPGEPFSPVRLRYVFSQFITPSNSAIKFLDITTTSVKDYLSPEEGIKLEKTKMESFLELNKKIPLLSRLIKWTDGTNLEMDKKAEEARLSVNSERADDNTLINYHLGKFRKARGHKEQLAVSKDALIVIRNSKNREHAAKLKRKWDNAVELHRKVGHVENPWMWYKIKGERDPVTRARMFYNAYKSATPDTKIEMNNILRKIPHIDNKDFRRELNRLNR